MPITDPAWVEQTARAVEADPEFKKESRFSSYSFLLDAGEQSYVIDVSKGRLSVTPTPNVESPWDFAVRGSEEAWERYINRDADDQYRDALGMWLQGAHSVTGNVKQHLSIEGNYAKVHAHLLTLYIFLQRLQKD